MRKTFIAHRQAVVNRVANNTAPFISAVRAMEVVTAARYDVINTSSTMPLVGDLHIPPSGLTLRINSLDKDGLNHYGGISTLKAGDVINIGVKQATLTNSPIFNTGVFALQVAALPALVDGEYLVSVTRKP